jgi:hypothetical protein
MHTFAYDKHSVTLVQILSGQSTESDYKEMVQVTQIMDRDAALSLYGSLQILVIDPGYANPNASQRKMIADTVDGFKARRYLFALVTDSSLIRGVLTAISWLRKERMNFHSSYHATFEDAARWAKSHDRAEIAPLHKLLIAARKPIMDLMSDSNRP